jgi:hypothetical protein
MYKIPHDGMGVKGSGIAMHGCCKVEEGAPSGATGRSHEGVLAPPFC